MNSYSVILHMKKKEPGQRDLKIDLKELVKEGIISDETAGNIEGYYRAKKQNNQSKLPVVFSIIGSVLTGLGIILLIAHNWDAMSREIRTTLGLLPLFISYLIIWFVILKRDGSEIWNEGAGVFHYFAAGASIALISQVYQITGEPGGFALMWSLFSLPVIYILNSSAAAGLYLISITVFSLSSGYSEGAGFNGRYYLLLLSALIPHFYMVARQGKWKYHAVMLSWIVSITGFFVLVTSDIFPGDIAPIALIAYFSLLYIAGINLREKLPAWNGFLSGGAAGVYILLYILSFDTAWNHAHQLSGSYFMKIPVLPPGGLLYPGIIIAAFSAVYGWLFVRLAIDKEYIRTLGSPLILSLPLAVVLYELAPLSSELAVIAVNLFILITGVLEIQKGLREDSLLRLNYGLVVILVLVVLRYFDMDMSFILRGLLLIGMGFGFFASNYKLLQNRKRQGNES